MGIEAALIGGGLGLLGSAVGGSMQASAARDAASTSANAQLEAARVAAEQSKFRPVGITSRFGQSQFGFSPEGYLTSAGYTVSPELQAIQGRIMGQAGAYAPETLGQQAQALAPAAQGLFNLGQQYIAQSPQEAAQQYMSAQQGLLAPSREQALSGIRNRLFQTGRTGLATGGTAAGSRQATNPELAAYYNAVAQQDAQLAAQAEQEGRARASYGAGLFGTGAQLLGQVPTLTTAGYGPLSTQLGLASTIEQLGQQPLDIGAQLGGRSATAGANAANALYKGGISAAKTMQAATGTSPFGALLQSAGGTVGNAALNSWMQNLLNQTPASVTSTPGYGIFENMSPTGVQEYYTKGGYDYTSML